MKKGIATETILLLLLGILVVGILVYLLYKYVFNPVLPEEMCKSRATSWCTLCKNAYSDFQCHDTTQPPDGIPDCYVPVGKDLSDCASEYFSGIPKHCVDAGVNVECCDGAKNWCAAFIGTG
jgi:hypothetical protein